MKQVSKIQDKVHHFRSFVDENVKCRERDEKGNKPHGYSVGYKYRYEFITAKNSADPKQDSWPKKGNKF